MWLEYTPRPWTAEAQSVGVRFLLPGSAIAELNRSCAVITCEPGRGGWQCYCRVARCLNDPRRQPELVTFARFRQLYRTPVLIGSDQLGMPRFVPQGQYWLAHRLRREYPTLQDALAAEGEGSYAPHP